jgi:predicted phage tail protein
MGSKSSSSSSAAPVEAPNNLLSTSRIKILDLLCEGPISGFVVKSGIYGNDPLVSTYYDDIPVRNLDGSYNFNVSGVGYAFNYTLGTSGQAPIVGFEKVENIIPLSSNTRIANPPVNGGSYKTVNASFNTSTYPDADTIKVTIRDQALFTTDSQGNTNGYEMTYAIDIATNNKPFVQVDEVTIRGKNTSPYLKTTSYTLPKTTPASSYYEWKVRIRRTSQNILSSRTANEMFVDSISVISSSQFCYPNSVLVGTEISFDQFSNLPTRAYEIDGLMVKVPLGYTPTRYNVDGTVTVATYPSIWMGQFAPTKKWTNNPAWILYDIISNNRYGLGQFIREDFIDKWSLYEIAQYCDELVSDGEGGLEPRFSCNVVISDRSDAYQLLLNLTSVFRGMMYWGNGRIFAIQTNDKAPIFNFTNANVINGQFGYSDSAGNVRSTVALVKYNDPTNFYREATILIEDRDGIARYGYINKEVSAFACTSKGQAYRIGNWILTTERLLTETITFQAGMQGDYMRPGDVFNVYDNYRNNAQQGGRIQTLNAARTSLLLDREVNLDAGVTYSLSAIAPTFNFDTTGEITGSNQIPQIRNSQIENRQVTTSAGSGITTLVVNSAYSTGLYAGSIWILSASGASSTNVFRKASLYKCLATSEISPGVVEILGLQYNTGINGITESTYSVISNPINSGDNSPINPPSGFLASGVTGLLNDNSFFSYIRLTWSGTSSTNLSYYSLSGQKFGGPWVQFSSNDTGYNFNTSLTGLHNFRLAAVSQGGITSNFLSTSYTVPSTNPLGAVTGLTGMNITANYDSNYFSPIFGYTGYVGTTPTLSWDIPLDSNGNSVASAQFISGYNLKFLNPTDSSTLSLFNISLQGSSNTSITLPKNYFLTGLSGGQRRLVKAYVEVVDIYGNKSSGASLNINNNAPLAPIGSGFTPIVGGLNYSVNPQSIDSDISGLYIWYNTGNTFVPTFANSNFTSANLAGLASNNLTGQYFVWYAIGDTFSFTGSQIYGPMTVATSAGITGVRVNVSPFINNSVTFQNTGQGISLTQQGSTIFISGSGLYSITGARDTYVNNYNVNALTLNNYTTDIENSAFAGINSGTAGLVYAQVSDLNTLRIAYENLRTSYDNSLQVQSQLIGSLKKLGLVI